jgi:hypothetical protein
VNALQSLRALVDGRRPLAPPEERCHLCGGPVSAEHRHVVDRQARALACACPDCAFLCEERQGRYRAVPNRVLADPTGPLDEATWSALGVPVRLAFLFLNSTLGRWIALYPSPAGAVEAQLEEEATAALGRATRLAPLVAPDVEALLVRGLSAGGVEAMLVPIDVCYRLVGGVRSCWEGLHGGTQAWRRIDALFEDLRARARPMGAA